MQRTTERLIILIAMLLDVTIIVVAGFAIEGSRLAPVVAVPIETLGVLALVGHVVLVFKIRAHNEIDESSSSEDVVSQVDVGDTSLPSDVP